MSIISTSVSGKKHSNICKILNYNLYYDRPLYIFDPCSSLTKIIVYMHNIYMYITHDNIFSYTYPQFHRFSWTLHRQCDCGVLVSSAPCTPGAFSRTKILSSNVSLWGKGSTWKQFISLYKKKHLMKIKARSSWVNCAIRGDEAVCWLSIE